jgi:tripartite-type tricarboxylate transporter receptor subunit TctC
MKKLATRSLLFTVSFCALAPLAIAQDNYPSKRITVLVAAGAGGFADSIARIFSERLSAALGQPVVIENRAGAGGNTGARAVARSEPDGYTILVSTTAMAINEALYASPGYATKEITPVAIVGSSPEVVAVHPDNAAKTLAQFLKPADGLPVQYGTAGNGSGSHIAAEYLFRIVAKGQSQHVPFAGGAPAIQNVLSNQLNSVVVTLPAITQYLQGGKVRGLAVMSPKRHPAIPDVPTLAEAGFPDYYASSWVGFFVPSATPAGINAKLNDEINKVVSNADVRARLEKLGLEVTANGLPATNSFFQEEIKFWTTRVNAIGLKIQ